ncbi:cell wall glucanase [Fusarium mundagurra]|uniref:Cell wall glucanase n=1 Tax=Fusarium mundagurra TaxID=1567541 RepID=A0A8H5YK27_9HYPO|nr:cell wall glucanase [Fusarium mundagurra]
MASTTTNSTDDPLHEPPGSSKPADHAAHDGRLKLGDFTKLSSNSLTDWASPKNAKASDSAPSLGNFKRLFQQIRLNENESTQLQRKPVASPMVQPITILKRPSVPQSINIADNVLKSSAVPRHSHQDDQEQTRVAASGQPNWGTDGHNSYIEMASEIHEKQTGKAIQITKETVLKEEMYQQDKDEFLKSNRPNFDPLTDSEAGCASDTDVLPATSYSTAASTPPSSSESPLKHFDETKKNKKGSNLGKSKSHSRDSSVPNIVVLGGIQSDHVRHVISYQHFKYGPLTEIHSNVQTTAVKHEGLMRKLVHERVIDCMICKDYPTIAENGIHVFVDMSNIIIGFQKALRARFGLPESSRFVPLPQMNLAFFHELLTRDRYAEWLNVGCSVRPNRNEPTFVQELKDLGYRVDLRSRRPEQSGADDHNTFEAGGFRYVEDMVDETLQIRISESVMQYFEEPGTLVIATGDARPAKYSDGFLTQAQRALKMGWSVEVVSWKASLSSAWTTLLKDQSIGSRFRIIELDQFLDELWIC